MFLAGGALAQAENVSLVRLIATPEAFDGKRVQVSGFCSLEFEGHAVYLHRDDERYGHSRNGVWLEMNEALLRSTKLRKGHCLVMGRFDAKAKGHMSLFSGSLTAIERFDPWPPYPVKK